MESGRLAQEIAPVIVPQRKGYDLIIDTDEHTRPNTSAEALAALKAPFRQGGR